MIKRKYDLKITKIPPEQQKLMTFNKNTRIASLPLPSTVDMRSRMPAIYDQGDLGSCTANALCAGMQYKNNIQGSRLFLYYNERVIQNDVLTDSGAYISDGITSLKNTGVCTETLWPYDITKFAIRPPEICYTDASKHKIKTASNIKNTLTIMKTALANNYPFTVGILVYSSFESSTVAANGMVPMPKPRDTLLGGHAVLCVGYNDAKKLFIMRNSWGTSWGDKGYFYLPYAYLTSQKLSSDLWYISINT